MIFKGRVQGVGFRWRLMQIANRYNLTGYVRNLYNGNVECEAQGEMLDLFVKDVLMLNNDRFIQIDDYSIKELPVDEDERLFDVKY